MGPPVQVLEWRRNIGNMPYRRRHERIREVLRELQCWRFITVILTIASNLNPLSPLEITVIRYRALAIIDPINPANNNRSFVSFSPEECWRELRFLYDDLPRLFTEMNSTHYMKFGNGQWVGSEYAFCIFS